MGLDEKRPTKFATTSVSVDEADECVGILQKLKMITEKSSISVLLVN